MRWFTLSLGLVGVLLFACEDSSSSSPPNSASSSGGSSGTGSSSGGNGEPEPFTPAPKLKTGAINLFIGASSPGAGDNKLSIAGYFLDYSAAPAGSVPDGYSFVGVRATECTRRKSGTCEAVRCKAVKDPSFELSQAKYATAGEITVKRANGTELKSNADAQNSNSYLGEIADPAPGTDGESVTVTATGGDVPAFNETLAFATKLALKSSAEVSVARGTDVKVEWTGGGNGTVKLSGTGGSDGEFLVAMTCTFGAAAGNGTIPGVLLGDDVVGQKLSLGLYSIAHAKTVGDYDVEFTAQISDSGLGGGNVQLEVK